MVNGSCQFMSMSVWL